MRVTFFHAGAERFPPPAELDPDLAPHLFERGEHAWTVQTCARLARAGLPVTLTAVAPADGLIVFHVKERRALLRSLPARADVLLVGVRADNRRAAVADVEVVQNGRFADGVTRHFVPFWPQPGLVARRPERGDAVRRAAFKGFTSNLHPALRAAAWREFLAGRGVEWVLDAVDFESHGQGADAVRWPDYADIDVLVAIRPPDRGWHTSKPATKLYNAWRAGVPAVLGREFAYRELRCSELDYLEADGPEEARGAVVRLLEEQGLYRRMVENGARRAREFALDRVLERWRALLFDQIPAFAESPRGRALRRTPVPVRLAVRSLGRLLTPGALR